MGTLNNPIHLVFIIIEAVGLNVKAITSER